MSFQSGDAIQKRNFNLFLGDSGGPAPPAPCLDGPVWTAVALPSSETFIRYAVAASPSSLVVVGADPGTLEAVAFYSLDNGASWIPSTFPGGSFNAQFAAYGGGSFIAHQNGSGAIFYSADDGVNWSRVNIALGLIDRLSFANGVWLGTLNTPRGVIRSTNGGASWAASAGFPAGQTVSNVAGDGSLLIVAGFDGVNGRIYSSIDGAVSFLANSAPWNASTVPLDIAYSPTLNRFVGTYAGSGTWLSDDGLNWVAGGNIPNDGTNQWAALSWGDGVFLAVNRGGSGVAVSEDGTSWALAPNSLPVANAAGVTNNGSGTWLAQRAATVGTVLVGVC